jgi:hypothetical protein
LIFKISFPSYALILSRFGMCFVRPDFRKLSLPLQISLFGKNFSPISSVGLATVLEGTTLCDISFVMVSIG